MSFHRFLILSGLLSIGSFAKAAEPIWDANKIVLVSEKLGEGVFAVYPKNSKEENKKGQVSATSGGIVVGTRATLVIDTMLNKRMNESLQKQALNASKRKEITYALNTSAHGDHSFGNMYLPRSTKVIQHINTRSYIASHLDDDKKFMIQNFGAGRGIEEIKGREADILIPVNGKITLDLGGRSVDIIDFGFAQTGGDLFVWEPITQTLWAGNAINAPKPALPWLLDGHIVDTYNTLKKVYDFLPEEAQIIPGHGVAMKKEDLNWHIDYLDAVIRRVKDAIAQGLSLEETVAKVQLPEFQGYAIFGWIHQSVNVPAAYKELKVKP
ncbi:MAG TPA: MBL fold metallo-hydrolase [Oligoflexus sp.]|uniref:MBL fold metallo-hydrolase n=1 Tax=Oligoflexus sp. TaxID=1971216 RepID=UPI002D7E2D6C|nr:MBL fold metallo-hydrolase [Oligoflexus sp.]HET9236210.1 MBL fold metallo-hydrolase [Oligoflexus sp.]